ncbi:hypothetical protein DRJ17_04390 [Candidatus Woesearchaeota archaeon]|nr:MAG: hypothetical protein DRJ17_04390 [Candidatus Woesearchaeota archaeon]
MRKINKKRYVIAGLLTFFIFMFGLLLGLIIEGERVSYISEMYRKESIDLESSQLQFAYLETLKDKDMCPVVFGLLDENVKASDKTRIKLENYNNDKSIRGEDFELLKKEYTLSLIRYWMLAKKAKDICDVDTVRVLYFYSDDKECPKCGDQAVVLTYLKKKFNEKLLIFALDSKFEKKEPIIRLLKKQYDISVFPSLVIEEDKVEGFIDKAELIAKLCDYYEGNYTECTKI